jgi:hypothetical protein
MFNEWVRHIFLGIAMMLLVFLGTSVLSSSQTPSGTPAQQAMDLMRELNSIQVLMAHSTQPSATVIHTYASKEAMLGPIEPGLAWKVQSDQAKADTPYGAFLRSLAPNDRNGEILAGWITDIDIKPNGYVIINSQKVDAANPNKLREAVITGETGVIYRARVLGPTQPAAADLHESRDFPGAQPWDLFANNGKKRSAPWPFAASGP